MVWDFLFLVRALVIPSVDRQLKVMLSSLLQHLGLLVAEELCLPAQEALRPSSSRRHSRVHLRKTSLGCRLRNC